MSMSMDSTQEKNDSKMEGKDEPSIDGRTNSERGQELLLLASILTSMVAPTDLGLALDFSEAQVAEIDEGLVEDKNKILRLLERFSDRNPNWHENLMEAVQAKLDNTDLASHLRNALQAKRSEPTSKEDATKEESRKGHSGMSSWDMTSGGHSSHGSRGSHGSHSSGEPPSSDSFERVSEENVFLLRDGEQPSREDLSEGVHASVDPPETSLQIEEVGRALQVVSNLLGDMEGIKQLPEVIPRILTVARQMKTQKVLRHVFEEENINLKQDLQNANESLRKEREKIEKLEAELAELKKAAEDKTLADFDYVTRKEAEAMKDEEMKEQAKQQQASSSQTSPSTDSASSEGVSLQAYETLQKKIICLKQKLSEVVKLNHMWDEQYHRMETALRQELENAKKLLTERSAESERREKENSEILKAMKSELEKSKTEKAELQKTSDQVKQQLSKANRYAVSLQKHKVDLEAEVGRLNEALEQKLLVSTKPAVVGPPAASHKALEKIQGQGLNRGLSNQEERSLLTSLPQEALVEELELLKQQLDVYRSDFYREQRDKQRTMGELEEVKTELHRTQRKMERQKAELQILQDHNLAYKFHTKELIRGPPTTSQREKVGQKPRSADLVPHGANYAMNDEYVDAAEDIEIYYPPASLRDSYQGDT
ncbi:uncharacterized protein [Diadema antillarum]|uniref:uncharacterized protein isoform X2 n=1 Tax=Diadema antillarum TaxID=105358 RepID=UPI003A899247